MKNKIWIFLVLVFMSGCSRGVPLQTGSVDKSHLLYLHNMERADHHAGLLLWNPTLDKRAQDHAEWMAKHRRLQHSKIGKTFNMEGENIAMGYETEEDVLDGWMHSPGHKRNILNGQFDQVGFGYAVVNGDAYWCTIFGSNL